LVVCLTFIINKITDRLTGKKALLLGLVLYGIGYVAVTSSNTWYVLIIFNFIATVGELVYSPIRNAEQANMIPADKRGSYSAFAGLSDIGADLIARMTIIVGAFLIPTMMSVYIGMIVIIGAFFLYKGLYVRSNSQSQESLNKISI
ncbi:MFS transporter, partial [Bacillus albus]|uniref:MFS transporter n=3 Tax=Bacillaceae TaxID=186817 RepID=UPI003014DDAD